MDKPEVGSFVEVPFGGVGSTQTAHVCGWSRDGKNIKVRAWNNAQRKWMQNLRSITFGDWIKPSKAEHLYLPAPPAIKGT